MTPFMAYCVWFTPLSPIHIGAGQTYEPTNYVIEGDTLHEFETSSILETLSGDDRRQLGDLVNGSPDDTMIKGVQRFFWDRRTRLIPWAIHRIPVQRGVVNLYTSRVGQTAQQEGRGRRTINQLEIARTAYNPITRLPVLLGSSLKGAIRTALLDHLNDGRATVDREGLHPFQGNPQLFRYYERRPVCERDPMRLVQISDAEWKGEAGLPAAEVVFAVNRKKAPVADRQGNRRGTRAESGPPQILECVPPLRYRVFAGQLNLQSLGDVNRPGQVPPADLRFDMGQIGRACTAFYRPILERELQLLAQHGWLDTQWGQAIDRILSDRLKPDRNAFLLRVGRHCGAESVTLNGVRKIRIMGGRNRPDRQESEATTIWLAAREREQISGMLPFGWLLGEYAPLPGRPESDNAQLKALFEQRLGPIRQWADRLKAKEPEWQRARQAARATAGTEGGLPRSRWVEDKLKELCSQPGRKPEDQLRSKALAEAVRAIEDEKTRREAVADIVSRWKEKGWWDKPSGGAAKQAKAIYDELLSNGPSS
jgi:CRISPR-associated protein Csm5